jgi:hypothetical protein
MGRISKLIPVLSRIVMFIGIIMVFMTTSFTAKAEIGLHEVNQVSQTSNSVTVKLHPSLVKSAKKFRYGICEITKGMSTFDAANAAHKQAISKSGIPCTISTKTNTYTFTGLKPGTCYYICFGYDDKDYQFTHNCLLTTMPDKPSGLKVYSTSEIGRVMKVDFRSGIDEYKYKLYNIEGDLVERGTVDNSSYGVQDFFIRYYEFPAITKLVLTPVATINEREICGESATTYIIDQPNIVRKARSRAASLKNGKLTFSWYKVEGATAYDIYISENRTTGFEKAATVKGKNDTVTIKKCHKKKIKKNKTYYVSIRPKFKANGTTYTAHDVFVWEISKKSSRQWRND